MNPRPLNQIFIDLAGATPDWPALTFGDLMVSRAELENRADTVAAEYERRGVGLGSWVTLALRNGPEFFAACRACWKLGATPQPLSPELGEAETRRLLELTDPALVVGLEIHGFPTMPAGSTPPPNGPVPERGQRISPRWKAIVSCGSTAAPHIVVAELPGQWDLDRQPLGMNHEEVQLVSGPLYHEAHFGPAMFGLFFGHQVVVLPKFDATAALAAISDHAVTFAVVTPAMLHAMLRVLGTDPDRYDLSSLRAVWHMGAPCAPWLKEAWLRLLGPDRLFEFYGMAEAPAATTITGHEWLKHRGSVGRPLFGEVKVVDQAGRAVEPDSVGEVYLRPGAGIRNEHRPIGFEQDRRLPDGWQSFGDLGWLDDEGYLYLCDRLTDVIRAETTAIYPHTVEAPILEHPQVLSCAVVGLPGKRGERVHAVVQSRGPLTDDDLRAYLTPRMAPGTVPATFRFVGTPLRDACDKVNRPALRQQEIQLMSPSRGNRCP